MKTAQEPLLTEDEALDKADALEAILESISTVCCFRI